MRATKIAFLLILLIGFFSLSCKDNEKSMYLSTIAEMQHRLDSLDTLANANRIDTLNLLVNHIKSKTKEVAEVYAPDTVDYEVAEMMNAYKESRKALSSNSGNLAKVRQSIPEVRESLENLAHDIAHGVGEREKYQEHITFEEEKLFQIQEILSYYLETKTKYEEMFRENDKKVIAFIETLKQQYDK